MNKLTNEKTDRQRDCNMTWDSIPICQHIKLPGGRERERDRDKSPGYFET
jgi:hypothetical protein